MTKKVSTETFNRQLEYRKRKGLCLRCGKKPCICLERKDKKK